MRHLATTLLWRSTPRVAAFSALIGVIGAVALIFALMGPSNSALALTAWQGLPDGLRVADADPSASTGDCLTIFSRRPVGLDGERLRFAHADVVIGAEAMARLRVPPVPDQRLAVLDLVAAQTAGVDRGDTVRIYLGRSELVGQIEIVDRPIQLNRGAEGTVFLADRSATRRELKTAIPPDAGLCFGVQTGGETVAERRDAIAAAQRARGSLNSSSVFAASAAVAGAASISLAFTMSARRRGNWVTVLETFGQHPVRAARAALLDAGVGSVLGLLIATTVAVIARRELLRLWTDPLAVGISVGVGTSLIVLCWTLAARWMAAHRSG